MSFDLSKCERNEHGHYLCQTRGGESARIVCVDLRRETGHCLLTVVQHSDGHDDSIRCYTPEGRCGFVNSPSNDDLVNIPRKVKRWVVIVRMKESGSEYTLAVQKTKAEAKEAWERLESTAFDLLACVPVEWEEA